MTKSWTRTSFPNAESIVELVLSIVRSKTMAHFWMKSQKTKVPKEQIKCDGCLGSEEMLWQNCKKCSIRACLTERGLNFCYECAQFDDNCEKYDRVCKLCSERGENIRESMRRVKIGDAETWLKEQDEKWRCSNCGGKIHWYEEVYHHCDAMLNR